MKNNSRKIHNVVIIGSMLAALGGLLLRSYSDIHHVLVGFLVVVMFFLTLAVVPLLIIEMVIMAIAKARRRAVSSAWVWGPALTYIVLSAASGWEMGTPTSQDPGGLAGLSLFIFYLNFGGIVLLISLVSGIVGLLNSKKAK